MRIIYLVLLLLTACTGTFALHEDNDFFTGIVRPSDQYYTQGLSLGTTYDYDQVPEPLKAITGNLPQFCIGAIETCSIPEHAVFEVGQQIYTPSANHSGPQLPGENPYAGWLYTHAGRINHSDTYETDTSIYLGVVGPHAYGEQVQNNFHKLIGQNGWEGWDNQLKDEPAFYAEHGRNFIEFNDKFLGLEYAVISSSNFRLGTVHTDMQLGEELLYGYDLQPLKPNKRISVYGFVKPVSSIVARNIFYDGGTFRSYHNLVHTEPAVATVQVGVGLEYADWVARYQMNIGTREFEEQQDRIHLFGQIIIEKRYK